jgi:LysR family hydrogen peroxide-inducible transcriptional activator
MNLLSWRFPPDHPLAKRSSISLNQLEDQSLLLLEEGHCLREQALEVCQLAGAAEKGGFRATSLETLRQMVAADVGITLLPMLAVKPPIPANENIHLVQFRTRPPSRHIAMIWRKSSAMHAFLREFAQLLRQLPVALLEPDPQLTVTSASPE